MWQQKESNMYTHGYMLFYFCCHITHYAVITACCKTFPIVVFFNGELIGFIYFLFFIADMGIRLWWRILRGDSGISIRYKQFLVLEYDFFKIVSI